MDDAVKTSPLTAEEAEELKIVRVPVVTIGKHPAPARPVGVVKAPSKPVAPIKPPKPETIKSASQEVSLLDEFVKAMPAGMTLTITRTGVNQWNVTKGTPTAIAASSTVARKAGKRITAALTDDYKTFLNQDAGKGVSWHAMSLEDKYAYAQEIGASWVVHADARIDLMRMTVAVLTALGIKKHVGEEAPAVVVAPEPAAE